MEEDNGKSRKKEMEDAVRREFNFLPHCYKTQSNSSKRVALYASAHHHTRMDSPLSRCQKRNKKRRGDAKDERLLRIAVVATRDNGMFSWDMLSSRSARFFFEFCPSNILPSPVFKDCDGVMEQTHFFNDGNFELVDGTDDARAIHNGSFLFVKASRAYCLNNSSRKGIMHRIGTLEWLELHLSSVKRGSSHHARSKASYYTCGNRAMRGGVSVTPCVTEESKSCYWNHDEGKLKDCHPSKNIYDVVCDAQEVASFYLPSFYLKDHFRGLQLCGSDASKIFSKNKDKDTLISSFAVASDYWSMAHCDEDSSLAILRCVGLNLDRSKSWADRVQVNLEPDALIVQYFVFPEAGVAVALRPGDFLIFNPLQYHCCSKRLDVCNDTTIKLVSFYNKARVLGKNSNSIPLSPEQEGEFAKLFRSGGG